MGGRIIAGLKERKKGCLWLFVFGFFLVSKLSKLNASWLSLLAKKNLQQILLFFIYNSVGFP